MVMVMVMVDDDIKMYTEQFLNNRYGMGWSIIDMELHLQFIIIVSNLKMSHYNNTSPTGIQGKQNSDEIGSFQKSVMSNNKESIEKHLSHMKIQSNQLNYALFLSIDHFRLDEHTEECVLLLLRHKSNPNCELNKQTPLTAACRKGQQLLVKTLLENGAKPDLCNKNGEHPLAVILKDKRQNYDVAHTLISYMASINIQIGGRHPIVIAVQREFLRIFQMLIQKGANLVFESENILHIVVKKKFKKLDKKKKFIKELAGRLFLMQEDSNHKLPTDYQESEQIRAFIHENFKQKILKQDSYKQESNTKSTKQKESKDGSKHKELEATNGKEFKKKILNHKQLDTSFSEVDEEQFQDEKGEAGQDGKKLKEVLEIPEQEEKNQIKDTKENRKLSHEKQTTSVTNSPLTNRKQIQIVNSKQSDHSSLQAKQIKKQKSAQQIQCDSTLQKQRDQEKQKIKKKLNSTLSLIEPKKKSNISHNVVQINNIGTKKKKQKNQQILSKTLLKRKNSSIEEQSIKLDKIKATAKKPSNGKKQVSEFQQKIEKEKAQEEDKIAQLIKSKIIAEEEKIEKESQTDSQEGYQGSITNLNEEIFELVNKIDEKYQQKIPMVQEVLRFLEDTMRSEVEKQRENARLEMYLYGSQATGLAIMHSDIDVLVLTEFQASWVMKLLQQRQTLNVEGIKQVKFIPGATVPVIKLKMSDKFDNIHVDITFNNKNHMGLKCCEMIKSFMQAEPLLRPLVLVIKILVDAYDISDPYKGGLSSYAITLMVIALLQFTEKSKKTLDNVGELLMNFLYFYGEQIDYISQAIIIHALGLFGEQPVYCIYRLPYITDLNPKLIIYDPLNPVNNVGRTTYRIAALKKLFSVSYLRLKSDCRCELKDIFDGSFNELLTDF